MNNRSAPGYTVNDLVYWGAFMAATGVTYLACQAAELHRLVALLISLGVGVAVGTAAEYVYRQAKKPPPPREEPPGT
jgi:hypothetical protein